jgi:hypothetical protein
LITMQEDGQEIDEEELYELELLDRFSAGEDLMPEELDDLDFIVEHRKRREACRREFEVATSMIEAGELVDEDRYYFLGLVEKQRLGHSLTEDEIADIQDFDFEADESEMSSKVEIVSESGNQPTMSAADEARNRAMALLNASSVSTEPQKHLASVTETDNVKDSNGELKAVSGHHSPTSDLVEEEEEDGNGELKPMSEHHSPTFDHVGEEENSNGDLKSASEHQSSTSDQVGEAEEEEDSNLIETDSSLVDRVDFEGQLPISEPLPAEDLNELEEESAQEEALLESMSKGGDTKVQDPSTEKKATGWGVRKLFGFVTNRTEKESGAEESHPANQTQEPVGRSPDVSLVATEGTEEQSLEVGGRSDSENPNESGLSAELILDPRKESPWQVTNKANDIEKNPNEPESENEDALNQAAVADVGAQIDVSLNDTTGTALPELSDLPADPKPAILRAPVAQSGANPTGRDEESPHENKNRTESPEAIGPLSLCDIHLVERAVGSKDGVELANADIDLTNERPKSPGISPGENEVGSLELVSDPSIPGQPIIEDDDTSCGYEESLLERERNGDDLSDDELFVLDEYLMRKEEGEISQEEWDDLRFLKNQESGREENGGDNDEEKEFADLKQRALHGETFDEERLYELNLICRFRNGDQLTENELVELDALERLRSGEELSAEELEDLRTLRNERANALLEIQELENLRSSKDDGRPVDETRLFELTIREKVRNGSELNDEELYALELFDKIEAGEELTDVEMDDLDLLLGHDPSSADGTDLLMSLKEPTANDPDRPMVATDDGQTVKDIKSEDISCDDFSFNSQKEQDVDIQAKKLQADQPGHIHNGEEFEEANMEEHEAARNEIENSLIPIDMAGLRERRDAGLEYDEDLLYELELLERRDNGEDLDDDELFEIDMFDKRARGTELSDIELGELELLKKRRIDQTLDEEELLALRERVDQGEEVDEDLLHELELFARMRAGDQLSEDELFELDMFQLIRDGETLTEEQIHELEILKGERMEAALDKEDLRLLREMKARGEPVDEDFLHELELFQRKRIGDVLSEDEMAELALFQRRRNGEELLGNDIDELNMLRNERLGEPLGTRSYVGSMLDQSDNDDDSVYRRTLLDRQMKGQRLDKQEFLWLELLQKAKRGEGMLEDERDELDVMRKQRKEATVEVEQTRKLLEKEMEKKAKRELKQQRRKEREERKLQKRLEKEERREQRKKEKEHQKMLRERRAKVKRMRKNKSKQETKETHSKTEGSITKDAKSTKDESNNKAETNTAVEIVNIPSLPPRTPSKSEEQNTGLFGGVFGRNKKSKKEIELEEARRRQEELIKEQMKALALENELKVLEKEKELQKELVQETVERKTTGSLGSSSWETESAAELEESDGESSVISSSEESESESDSDSSVDSTASFEEEHDSKEVQENGIVSERRAIRVAKRREMDSRLRMSLLKRQESKGNPGDIAPTNTDSHHDHPAPNPVLMVDSNEDASIVSEEPQRHEEEGTLEDTLDRPTKSKSKTITLSAHLRKKYKKRSTKKNKARYGDDLSLGTMQLSKMPKSQQQENDPEAGGRMYLAQQDIDRMNEKSDRPWVVERETEDVERFSVVEAPRKVEKKPDVEKFFNSSNQHVFDRSVFNFNQSFGSKLSLVNEDDGSRSKVSISESESVASGRVAKEAELEGSTYDTDGEEDAISMMESMSSYISLTEEKYIFQTPDYETIETRLAEKLRTKEAEFDAAWENIVADENVAAQINQRLRERQRTNRSENKKEEKAEESNGYYDVPRLFLFEGEKTKSKKKKRKKRKQKDRKLQKKLDRTLSKEFRKAMREVFESDSEEEYDKTFGEGGDDAGEGVPDRQKAMRRSSTGSSDNSWDESGSVGSEQSDDFDHGGYMARLRDRSMQQEVRKVLHESRRQLMAASNHSQMSSDDELSQNSDASHREQRGDHPTNSENPQRKKKKPRKNRTGELVGEGIDPADVYAKELERQKEKKSFTVADLRKEMEELKQANFGPPPDEKAQSVRKLKTPKKPKSSANIAGPGGLPNQRPGLGNKLQSFTTAATELGLLSGVKAGAFGVQPHTIQEEEEDDEDAFLTGGRDTGGDFDDDGAFNDSKASAGFGFRGAGFSNFNFFSGAAFTKTPSKSPRKKVGAFASAFGGFGAGASSPDMGGGGDAGNDLADVGPPLASPGGFQEPLPVPEMQDEDKSKSRRSSMFSLMGKSSKKFIPKFKMPIKRSGGGDHGGGFMMDDDDDDQFEGGMGLLR